MSDPCGCGCTPCQCFGPVVNGQLPACPPRHPCTCGQIPCFCPGSRGSAMCMDEDVNPNKNCCTVCTGDRTDNIWYVNGKCKLDELTYEQVWVILLKIPAAKKDLQRITSDPVLLTLANNTQLITDEIEDDRQAGKRIDGSGLPYYTLFRGNLDGSVI